MKPRIVEKTVPRCPTPPIRWLQKTPLPAWMNRLHQRLPLVVFLFFLLIYLFTARGVVRGMDETVMFTTLANLVDRHTLAIDELVDLHTSAPIGEYGAGGHLYSKYPPGNLVFGIGLYSLGRILSPAAGQALATLLNPLLATGAMLLLFQSLRKRFRTSTALVTTLLVGVCSSWWFDARGFGSEIGSAAFLLASLAAAEAAHPCWSAAAFAMSFVFRPVSLVALPVWLHNLERHRKQALVLAALTGLPGLALLAYNAARFGHPFQFGYSTEGFTNPLLQGLVDLLFSPGRSLFLFAPYTLLAGVGLAGWVKRDRRSALVLGSTVAIYLAAIATWHDWDGGWSWGPRLLIPIYPLLGLLAAPAVEFLLARSWGAGLVGLLGLAGFSINALTLFQDPFLTMQTMLAALPITYADTVFSPRYNMVRLQLVALRSWVPGEFDALLLKVLWMLLKSG